MSRTEVYNLKLFLAGEREPIFQHIIEADLDRLSHCLNNDRSNDPTADPGPQFFVWDVPTKGLAAVSVRDLQLVNAIWGGDMDLPDAPTPPREDEDDESEGFDDGPIEIRLRGAAEPFFTHAEHMEYVANLEFWLDAMPDGFGEFIDEDGDRVWVRADQLVYLYIPKWIMDEGRRVNDEQRAAEDAAADAGKQKRARAKRPKAAS